MTMIFTYTPSALKKMNKTELCTILRSRLFASGYTPKVRLFKLSDITPANFTKTELLDFLS